jgi:hypothetical protein
MEQGQPRISLIEQDSLGTLIVSEVRFLLESLAEILDRTPGVHVCGQCTTLARAIAAARTTRPARPTTWLGTPPIDVQLKQHRDQQAAQAALDQTRYTRRRVSAPGFRTPEW